MARRPCTCTVCQQASKYTCGTCRANYCSVACYKSHKEMCTTSTTTVPSASQTTATSNPNHDVPVPITDTLPDPTPLRPLTSLTWPYVPDTSAYPDPLQRDDPKPLQLPQYEAIARSPVIRTLLDNPRLRDLLVSIDALRGAEREEALERALGVDSRLLKNDEGNTMAIDEDVRAFRALAEGVEGAVRGGREDVLGLDWDQH